jgi:peptidoglycan/LPS O-acetylase OafA/YrhL
MTRAQIPSLTGLRFAAAFSILVLHTADWCIPFDDHQVSRVAGDFVGVYGMTLFFVLSGFVIHYNYASLFGKQEYGHALREFFVARFARIYPLYFFFFLFGVISDFMADWIRAVPRALVSYLVHAATLTQSWVYKLTLHQKLLFNNGFGLAWSISSEVFFYLAYTIFVFAILALRRPGRCLAALGVFSAAILGALSLTFLHLDGVLSFFRSHWTNFLPMAENYSSSFFHWLFYTSPYVRICEFVLGCLTAQLFLLVQDRPILQAEQRGTTFLLYAALGAVFVFGVAFALAPQPPEASVSAVQFFQLDFGCAIPAAAIIFCVARYRSPVAAFLSTPWMVWLGDISYSIYAVHIWTLRPFERPPTNLTLTTAIDAVVRVTLAIVFTIIVATATFRIIEVPCRRYLRARLAASAAKGPAVSNMN